MSKAQAPPSRAQPKDVAASPFTPEPAMLQLPLPIGRPEQAANHSDLYSIKDIDSHNDLVYENANNNNNSNGSGILSEVHVLTTHHHRHQNYFNAESHVGRNHGAGTLLHSRVPPHSLELTTLTSATEEQQRAVEEFYRSYDPQIGLHTAAVLGGILGWLIVYLLYKTKVKKWALTLVRGSKQPHRKRQSSRPGSGVCEVLSDQHQTPNHHFRPQLFQQYGQFQQVCQDPEEAGLRDQVASPQSSLNSGKLTTTTGKLCPMPSIVIESYSPPKKLSKSAVKLKQTNENVSKQPTPKPRPKIKPAKRPSKKGQKYKRIGSGSSRNKPNPQVTVLDPDDPDTSPFLLPPCCDSDSAQATARWVQNMPLLMQSYQDLTGLVLKVHPLMAGPQKPQSCPLISAALQYAALPVLGLPNLGWNKSLPVLTDKSGAGSMENNELDKPPRDADSSRSAASSLPPPPLPPRPRTPPSREAGGRSASPPRHPPPRLLLPAVDQPRSLSAASLCVPVSPAFPGTYVVSAPASPVPLPVTPLVTIQHVSSRACRSTTPQQQPRADSQDSFSSSSSADALLHVLEPTQTPHASPYLLSQPPNCPHVSRSTPHISWPGGCDPHPRPLAADIPHGVVPRSSNSDECFQTVAAKAPDAIFTLETKL